MPYSLIGFALLLLSSLAHSEPAKIPDNFSQKVFEQRFRAADKDSNGMLSREEAYAEFPRMSEYFDEIDANHDDQITLVEVDRAMQRRLSTAMGSGRVDDADKSDSGAKFSSKAEAQRYKRYEFYESLAERQQEPSRSGQPVSIKASPNLLQKSF